MAGVTSCYVVQETTNIDGDPLPGGYRLLGVKDANNYLRIWIRSEGDTRLIRVRGQMNGQWVQDSLSHDYPLDILVDLIAEANSWAREETMQGLFDYDEQKIVDVEGGCCRWCMSLL